MYKYEKFHPHLENGVTNYSEPLSWMCFFVTQFFVHPHPSHVVYPYTNVEMMILETMWDVKNENFPKLKLLV